MDAYTAALGINPARIGSQVAQDEWVLQTLKYPRGGFFIDLLGAHDRETLSNTMVMEKLYVWKGIWVEANPYSPAVLADGRSS